LTYALTCQQLTTVWPAIAQSAPLVWLETGWWSCCESFQLLYSHSYPAVLLQLKSDDRPPHVVTVLMQELSANNENDWQSQDAMHILNESLALSCLGEDFVGEQLKAGHNGL